MHLTLEVGEVTTERQVSLELLPNFLRDGDPARFRTAFQLVEKLRRHAQI
jgi:hypothetical protein